MKIFLDVDATHFGDTKVSARSGGFEPAMCIAKAGSFAMQLVRFIGRGVGEGILSS